MKKNIIKLLIIIGMLFTIHISYTNAGIINIGDIDGINEITKVTIEKTGNTNIVEAANDIGFSLLRTAKVILQAILVIYIVYTGGTMIMSMGDDGDLTKAKDQLRYSLLAIIFINIPGTIYEAITLTSGNKSIYGDTTGYFTDPSAKNLFINLDLFGEGLMANLISAIEVFIFTISIYIIIMAGIKIMTARGRDEKINEAKQKILYSFFAMIFVGFIEAWKQFAVTGKMSFGTSIFGKMTDIALLFAGPIIILFLTLAGYYYITANGDEEKTKKAKNIVINTLIATLILVVMVTFLNDLITL